jgi:hypothetical protein
MTDHPMHRAVPAQEKPAFASAPSRGRTAVELAMSDLDAAAAGSAIDAGAFRAGQIAATLRHTPFMMAGNILGACTFAWIAWDVLDRSLVALWTVVLVLPAVYLLVTGWLRRRRVVKSASTNAIRRAELYAIILGFAWASFPALFFANAPPDLRLLIVAMLLAACGSGAFALSKIPSAGIIFTLMICSSMSIATLQIGGYLGIVFAVMSLLYGIMTAASILSTHYNAIERAADAANLDQQREIITLLLHDFERGASDWLWETDENGKLVYFSDRMAEALHRGRPRLLGASLMQATGATPSSPGWREFNESMAARETISGLTIEVEVNGETRWWTMSAKPLFDAGKAFTGYRGVGRDITREHQSREELLRAKVEAERASAAKSQFLAVMSHELKTPLNAIIGFSEILAAGPNGLTSQTEQVDYAKTILESSTHLRSLINDILDVTRIERGTMAIVEHSGDAVELTEVAVKMCRDLAQASNIEIVLQYRRTAEITGDITRLKQVIINLVTNAVKFSPHGATVEVSLNAKDDGALSVEVHDRGIGIAPEDCKRVFEPFVQADEGAGRRFGGLGLGLAIARKIARLHGGDVILESKLGHGTTARFTLPPARVTWQEQDPAKAVA